MFGKEALREEIIDLNHKIEQLERNAGDDTRYIMKMNRIANDLVADKEELQRQLDISNYYIDSASKEAAEIEAYLIESGFNYSGMIKHIEQRKNKKYFG